MSTKDLLYFGVVLIVPVICGFMMGRDGTFTENKKSISSYGVAFLATAYYFYSIKKDLPSAILETAVGTLLFGAIGYVIISQFEKKWQEKENIKRELEEEREENRKLRDELRNK